MKKKVVILLVENETSYFEKLYNFFLNDAHLKKDNIIIETSCVASCAEVFSIINAQYIDLIITSIHMPAVNVVELQTELQRAQKNYSHIDLLTQYDISNHTIFEQTLLETIKKIVTHKYDGTTAHFMLHSNNRIMQTMLNQLEQIALSQSKVLILGESGVGKEVLARAIHEKSHRQAKPFIKINCAALAPSLIESSLFGHEKGAFTNAIGRKIGYFEQAHGGTIFLDEIGELNHEMQAKLLRVLQEKCFERVGGENSIVVDVRIITATNRNLKEMIDKGLFRQDLYYRLEVITLHVPPLRERKEDIKELAYTLLHTIVQENARPMVRISDEVLSVFEKYMWPGNIRELRNVIERAVVYSLPSEKELYCRHIFLETSDMCHERINMAANAHDMHEAHEDVHSEMIDTEHDIKQLSEISVDETVHNFGVDFDITSDDEIDIISKAPRPLVDIQLEHIIATLRHTKGNKTQAAEILQISRKTLQRKLAEYEKIYGIDLSRITWY